MKIAIKKRQLAQKRRYRMRRKIIGTSERPRLSLRLSNQHIYAQAIDDTTGKTLACVTSLSKDVRDKGLKPNVAGATELGKLFGEKAKAASVEKVVFDRGGRRYHGVVKAFAEGAREAGLNF